MANPFSKFENFGAILDPEKRQALAKAIFERLKAKSSKGIGFSNSNSENFAETIEKLLDHDSLNELCAQDKELAEKVTQEVLQFINNAKREITCTESPFEEESQLLNKFTEAAPDNFAEIWKSVAAFLKNNYAKNQIDISFYSGEFQKSLDSSISKKAQAFDNVKKHFSERWEKFLIAKQSAWEIEIIEKWRKKAAEELYKRIDDLKKLRDLLTPFTNELGRLFDMSKGN